MIKRVLIGLVLVGVLGCGTPPTPRTVAENRAHLLVSVDGSVNVKREGWSTYAPALFGTSLRYGDLLRVDGSATIVCADWTVAHVSSGTNGLPCNVAQPVVAQNGSPVGATREPRSREFPRVVAPRKTNLLNPHPTLPWTAVAGATSYTVQVRGSNVDWHTDVISGTELVYPASAPSLVPGPTYKVTVVTGGRSSDEEGMPGLGFTMLKADEATTVREAETKIRTLSLSDAATGVLIANLYVTKGLTAEAVERLEVLSRTTSEPVVLRSLGDLYLTLGLNLLAEERYLRAVGLSTRANDVEGQALTERALGTIYEALGNLDETAQRLQQAKDLYQQLGDVKTVAEIELQLAGLPKP